uniref:Fibrinogen C-terminal domain-containing protein n=1 Tax=Macrostomum lignano TaxID=282301 RepID=A0A1I8GB85_9PLAT
ITYSRLAIRGSRNFYIFQQRESNSVDFVIGWTEYKNGFAHTDRLPIDTAGLRWIRALTRPVGRTMRMEAVRFNGMSYHCEYSSFLVEGPDTGYALQYGSLLLSSSNVSGDSLSAHRRMKFQTTDANCNGNCCAKIRSGTGWWFNYCETCNPNGIYYSGGERNGDEYVHWDAVAFEIRGQQGGAPIATVYCSTGGGEIGSHGANCTCVQYLAQQHQSVVLEGAGQPADALRMVADGGRVRHELRAPQRRQLGVIERHPRRRRGGAAVGPDLLVSQGAVPASGFRRLEAVREIATIGWRRLFGKISDGAGVAAPIARHTKPVQVVQPTLSHQVVGVCRAIRLKPPSASAASRMQLQQNFNILNFNYPSTLLQLPDGRLFLQQPPSSAGPIQFVKLPAMAASTAGAAGAAGKPHQIIAASNSTVQVDALQKNTAKTPQIEEELRKLRQMQNDVIKQANKMHQVIEQQQKSTEPNSATPASTQSAAASSSGSADDADSFVLAEPKYGEMRVLVEYRVEGTRYQLRLTPSQKTQVDEAVVRLAGVADRERLLQRLLAKQQQQPVMATRIVALAPGQQQQPQQSHSGSFQPQPDPFRTADEATANLLRFHLFQDTEETAPPSSTAPDSGDDVGAASEFTALAQNAWSAMEARFKRLQAAILMSELRTRVLSSADPELQLLSDQLSVSAARQQLDSERAQPAGQVAPLAFDDAGRGRPVSPKRARLLPDVGDADSALIKTFLSDESLVIVDSVSGTLNPVSGLSRLLVHLAPLSSTYNLVGDDNDQHGDQLGTDAQQGRQEGPRALDAKEHGSLVGAKIVAGFAGHGAPIQFVVHLGQQQGLIAAVVKARPELLAPANVAERMAHHLADADVLVNWTAQGQRGDAADALLALRVDAGPALLDADAAVPAGPPPVEARLRQADRRLTRLRWRRLRPARDYQRSALVQLVGLAKAAVRLLLQMDHHVVHGDVDPAGRSRCRRQQQQRRDCLRQKLPHSPLLIASVAPHCQ